MSRDFWAPAITRWAGRGAVRLNGSAGVGALKGCGVDVRGKGGYVVAPGSTHESGTLDHEEKWCSALRKVCDKRRECPGPAHP